MQKLKTEDDPLLIQISLLSSFDRLGFLECFLYKITIAVRAIWSDDTYSDKQKLEALIEMNELNHRTWNLLLELREGEDENCIKRLYGNIEFYAEQSDIVMMHMKPLLEDAFNQFIRSRENL